LAYFWLTKYPRLTPHFSPNWNPHVLQKIRIDKDSPKNFPAAPGIPSNKTNSAGRRHQRIKMNANKMKINITLNEQDTALFHEAMKAAFAKSVEATICGQRESSLLPACLLRPGQAYHTQFQTQQRRSQNRGTRSIGRQLRNARHRLAPGFANSLADRNRQAFRRSIDPMKTDPVDMLLNPVLIFRHKKTHARSFRADISGTSF
jgi:hypothetical protein